MIIRSERSEIWSTPPTGLGPGQYSDKIPDFAPKTGLAPFSSTEERQTGKVSSQTPGPGTYNFDHSSIRISSRPSPQFISRSERMGGERQRMREMDTPGPGAYAPPVVQAPPAAIKSRPFHAGEGINWVKVATAPSIPSQGQSNGYEEGLGGQLVQQGVSQGRVSSSPGPGAYSPALDSLKSHGKIYQSFGRSHSAPRPNDSTPGPGSYNVNFVQDSVPMRGGVGSSRMHSMFASTTGRAKLSPDSYGPGPGGYRVVSGFKSLKQHLAANPDAYSAFGSSAKNPRTIIPDNKVPGPGSYTGAVTSMKTRPSPQFSSSSQRFVGHESFVPGPGTYEDSRAVFTSGIDSKTKGRFGVFGTTSSRFTNDHVDQLPPVGTYDTLKDIPNPADARRRDLRSSAFKAPSRPRSDAADDRPLSYAAPKEWAKPQSTSNAFIATVPRFGIQSVDSVPGPGAYSADLNASRGNLGKTPGFGRGSRFGAAEYQNTPGPGSYTLPGTLNHKTFNITIGDRW